MSRARYSRGTLDIRSSGCFAVGGNGGGGGAKGILWYDLEDLTETTFPMVLTCGASSSSRDWYTYKTRGGEGGRGSRRGKGERRLVLPKQQQQ